MKRVLLVVATMAAALTTGSCRTIAAEPPKPVALAVTNVTVIDPDTAKVLPGQTIFIEGDRIVAVVPAADAVRFAAAESIDGTGKFVIPGLVDMHAHLFLPEPAKPGLNLFIANGVTGIREMSSDCWEVLGATDGCIEHYRLLQAQVRAGVVPGPDIMGLTSAMVMGPARATLPEGAPSFVVPQTGEQGRELVRHLHARGPDLIKTHDSIPTAVFEAMMDEARRAGIGVGGHIPFGAGSLGAARLGYRSIEHARDLLYDCSRYGPQYRREEAAFAEGRPGAKRPSNLVRLRSTVDEFDEAACETMLASLAGMSTYYVPTHVTREMEAKAGDATYRSDPARKYVLPARNKNWEADLTQTAALPPAEVAALGDFFRHGLAVTALAHRAGVPIMTGSDANDTMIVPGFSLHRELVLLVTAGLQPMDALRAATSVPARYFGLSDHHGGISSGKEADLVILDADPLQDIRNTSRISAVIANGRHFDRAALDGLLGEVAAMAEQAPLQSFERRSAQ